MFRLLVILFFASMPASGSDKSDTKHIEELSGICKKFCTAEGHQLIQKMLADATSATTITQQKVAVVQAGDQLRRIIKDQQLILEGLLTAVDLFSLMEEEVAKKATSGETRTVLSPNEFAGTVLSAVFLAGLSD